MGEKFDFQFGKDYDESESPSLMIISNDESFIFINGCGREIVILKKINEKYRLSRRLKYKWDDLLEVRPHPLEKKNFICKTARATYEVKNIVEKLTIEVKGKVFQIRENIIISDPTDSKTKRISLQMISSKTGAPIGKEIKENVFDYYNFLLSVDEKYLLLKAYHEYWVWDFEKGILVENIKKMKKT